MTYSGRCTHSVTNIQTFSCHINSGLILSGDDCTCNAGDHRHIRYQTKCAAHRAIFINANSNKEKQHSKRYNSHGKCSPDFVHRFSTFVKLYTLFDKPLPPYLIHQPERYIANDPTHCIQNQIVHIEGTHLEDQLDTFNK